MMYGDTLEEPRSASVAVVCGALAGENRGPVSRCGAGLCLSPGFLSQSFMKFWERDGGGLPPPLVALPRPLLLQPYPPRDGAQLLLVFATGGAGGSVAGKTGAPSTESNSSLRSL